MSKVFKLIVDESNEPVILEEDEVLEDILIRLESISHRIDDIQYFLIKNAQFKKIVALSNLIQRIYHNDIRNMLP